VAYAAHEFAVLLPLPPYCWDYEPVVPYLAPLTDFWVGLGWVLIPSTTATKSIMLKSSDFGWTWV
jgi:hypothetical protein